MSDLDQQKFNAAFYAAKRFYEKKAVIGLGGGSTVRKLIDVLGKIKAKNKFVAVDKRNTAYARKFGLKIVRFDFVKKVDLAFDGADGIDKKFNMIKGAGGAAIEHEKLIDSSAKMLVIMVDRSKLKKDLLKIEIPIEVDTWAIDFVTAHLKKLGASAKLKKEKSRPFTTDHGNYVLNAKFRKNYPMEKLENLIKAIPGVIEVGIFTMPVDAIVVGLDKGAKVLS